MYHQIKCVSIFIDLLIYSLSQGNCNYPCNIVWTQPHLELYIKFTFFSRSAFVDSFFFGIIFHLHSFLGLRLPLRLPQRNAYLNIRNKLFRVAGDAIGCPCRYWLHGKIIYFGVHIDIYVAVQEINLTLSKTGFLGAVKARVLGEKTI